MAPSSISSEEAQNTTFASMEKHEIGGDESPISNYHENERKLVRKIDFRVIPGVVLLYLLSFLDRSNVANAKIEGLAQDLHMSTTPPSDCCPFTD